MTGVDLVAQEAVTDGDSAHATGNRCYAPFVMTARTMPSVPKKENPIGGRVGSAVDQPTSNRTAGAPYCAVQPCSTMSVGPTRLVTRLHC